MSSNGATAVSVEERHAVAPRVAWPLWALTVGLLSAIWPILIIPRLDLLSDPSEAFPVIGGSIFVVVTATGGALIASRRPANRIGWILLAVGLCWALGASTTEYAIFALKESPPSIPASELMAWFSAWLLPLAGGSLVALVPLFYPDERLRSRRSRLMALAAAVAITLTCLGMAFTPGPLLAGLFFLPRNPLGVDGVLFPSPGWPGRHWSWRAARSVSRCLWGGSDAPEASSNCRSSGWPGQRLWCV